jgi:preprotein translocase subunit SecD
MNAIAAMSKKAGLLGLFLIFAVLAVPFTADAQPVALEISAATVGFDQRTREPVVTIRLTSEARLRFARLTQESVGRAMNMIVDGRVVVKVVVREPITGGTLQISNKLTEAEARALAERLASGKAKFEVEVVT